MNERQWVQHKSGQGEKWEVDEELTHAYRVKKREGYDSLAMFTVPKSEYVLCDPPERWVEVSVQIIEHPHVKDLRDPGGVYDGQTKLAQLLCGGRYRVKKLEVEKKVTG